MKVGLKEETREDGKIASQQNAPPIIGLPGKFIFAAFVRSFVFALVMNAFLISI